MKQSIPFSIAALFCASGLATAEPVYTNPVGYTTTTLQAGFNNVGITLHSPSLAAGSLDVISSSSVQDTSDGVDFTAALGATGRIHILEITSGSATGTVSEFSTWTNDTITTLDNLSAAGVVSGDSYRIRKAPTLEELFGTATSGGPLTAGTAANADIVYVPTGVPGEYTQYFLSGAGAFRSVFPAALAPNVPIVYLDGLFINRRATGTVDWIVSGEVKTDFTKGGLVTGFNYLGTIFPAGSTIQNSGLENFLTSGTAAVADIIYVPTGTPGDYLQVFRSGAGTWRTVFPAALAPDPVNLNGAIFINRKGSPTSYGLEAPATWSTP